MTFNEVVQKLINCNLLGIEFTKEGVNFSSDDCTCITVNNEYLTIANDLYSTITLDLILIDNISITEDEDNTELSIFLDEGQGILTFNIRDLNLDKTQKIISICKDKGYTCNLCGMKNQNDTLTFNIKNYTYSLQDNNLLVKNNENVLETKEYKVKHIGIFNNKIVFNTEEKEIIIDV